MAGQERCCSLPERPGEGPVAALAPAHERRLLDLHVFVSRAVEVPMDSIERVRAGEVHLCAAAIRLEDRH